MARGASSTGGDLTTDGLPTITNRGELAPSMGSSSSSRRSSDPLSSEPGTPTHLPTLQNLHHLQVSCLCANPNSNILLADTACCCLHSCCMLVGNLPVSDDQAARHLVPVMNSCEESKQDDSQQSENTAAYCQNMSSHLVILLCPGN